MFWVICAALAAVVAIAVMAPFFRARTEAEPAAAYDLRVYRDQLREVDRDLARGVIAPEDADRLRAEIGRKVIEADRALKSAAPRGRGAARPLAAVILAVSIAGAFGIYAWIGAPDQPDRPLAARLSAAQATYASRPSQAEAEKIAPAKTVEPDPQFATLIAELRKAMAERPDDVQGLALLAENEARLGNFVAAKEAQAHLIEVKAGAATAADHSQLAGLMAEAAGGIITPEAEAELVRGLNMDPGNPQARYMAGLLEMQNGRPDRAFPIWRDLLAEAPNAPWSAPIRGVIMDLAWFAGDTRYQPPGTPSPPMMGGAMGGPMTAGPTEADVAAAGDMSAEDRQEMIRGMVKNLESRLATEGGSPEEWAQLIGSLAVLGEGDHARKIWAEAKTRFAGHPEELAKIDAAAARAGLE
ncbi:MAG: c-type cytochrome biogenesis protein CcmI [Paracoccus sp. (in: a-proteobacteria)]|nr:c-type cytochrome biogenesis protein CcmI [Paracoccus sp. (in: a-proteobacteria)]